MSLDVGSGSSSEGSLDDVGLVRAVTGSQQDELAPFGRKIDDSAFASPSSTVDLEMGRRRLLLCFPRLHKVLAVGDKDVNHTALIVIKLSSLKTEFCLVWDDDLPVVGDL